MNKEALDYYRIQYAKKNWLKYQNPVGWITVPVGIFEAIAALCDEVERLQKKVGRKEKA